MQAARAARAQIEADAGKEAEKAERAASGETTLAEWINKIWPSWDIELTTRAK